MADIDVKTKAKRVENETTKKQDADLKAAKAKIEEQNKKAEENKKKKAAEAAAKKAASAEEKKEAESSTAKAATAAASITAALNNKNVTDAISKVSSASSKVLGSSSESNGEELKQIAEKALKGKKQKGFFKGLIFGLVIGLVLGVVITSSTLGSITDKVNTSKENADKIIDENLFGYTAADFKEAVLGKAVEKQDLLVMEQPLTIETTITKAGLGNLKIFSKVKNVNFAGKGLYTVDLSKIDDEHIAVDETEKKVTITIPHAVLYEIVADFDNTTFEDTDKGLLAFGDLALSMEDQNELEKSVKESMQEELSSQELLDKADDIALTKTWEIFNPLIVAISDEFVTEIVFE